MFRQCLYNPPRGKLFGEQRVRLRGACWGPLAFPACVWGPEPSSPHTLSIQEPPVPSTPKVSYKALSAQQLLTWKLPQGKDTPSQWLPELSDAH